MKTSFFYYCAILCFSWVSSQSVNEHISQRTQLADFQLSRAIDSVKEYQYRLLNTGELQSNSNPRTLIFNSNGRISKVRYDNSVRFFVYKNERLMSIQQQDNNISEVKTIYHLEGKIGKAGSQNFYYDKNDRLDSIIENELMTTSVTKYLYDKYQKISEKQITLTGKLSGSIVKDLVVLYHMGQPYATFDLVSGDMSYLKTDKGMMIRNDKILVSGELKKLRELLAITKETAALINDPFDHFKISYDGWTVQKNYVNDMYRDWTYRAELLGYNLTNPLRYVYTRVIYYSNGKIAGTELPEQLWIESLPNRLEKI